MTTYTVQVEFNNRGNCERETVTVEARTVLDAKDISIYFICEKYSLSPSVCSIFRYPVKMK